MFGSNVVMVMSVVVTLTEKRLFFCTKSYNPDAGQLMTSNLDGTEVKKIWRKVRGRNWEIGINMNL